MKYLHRSSPPAPPALPFLKWRTLDGCNKILTCMQYVHAHMHKTHPTISLRCYIKHAPKYKESQMRHERQYNFLPFLRSLPCLVSGRKQGSSSGEWKWCLYCLHGGSVFKKWFLEGWPSSANELGVKTVSLLQISMLNIFVYSAHELSALTYYDLLWYMTGKKMHWYTPTGMVSQGLQQGCQRRMPVRLLRNQELYLFFQILCYSSTPPILGISWSIKLL